MSLSAVDRDRPVVDDLDLDVLRAVYVDGEPVIVVVPEEVADARR